MKRILLFTVLFYLLGLPGAIGQKTPTRNTYLQRIDELNRELKKSPVENYPSIYHDISAMHGKLGNTALEFEYYKKYIHYRDSLNVSYYKNKLDAIKNANEKHVWELQSDLYSEQIKRKNIQLILTGAIVLLLLLLIIDLIRGYRRDRNVIKKKREHVAKGLNPKSELLSRLSHDIRTPLNGIVGMVEVIRQTSLSEKQEEYMNLIAAASSNLLAILNNILDYTNIDPERISLEDIPFNVHQVVGDVSDLMVEKTNEKRLKLTTFVDPRIPDYLNGDPMRLKQVLIHLLKNALIHTETGEIFVSVEMKEQYDNAFELNFSVRDTGRGFSKAELDNAFMLHDKTGPEMDNPLFEVNLGLFISRGIVEKMSGEIGAESTVGVGSDFYFTAVFGRADNIMPKAKTVREKLLQKLNVLVVDPNQTSLNIFARYLEHLGSQYSLCQKIEQAIEKIEQEEPFKLVFLSHDAGDNLAAMVRQIKSVPKAKETSMVLISSVGSLYTSKELRSAGFEGVLNMPVKMFEMFDILVKICPDCLSEEEKESLAPPDLSSKRKVLLVEDNIINEKVARVSLERIGHSVDSAENGLIAIEMYRNNQYDLILMDLQMPVMDGFVATKEIRELEKQRGVPANERIKIVALTANTTEADRKRCFDAGMDDYIAKPFNHAELLRVLES